MKEHKKLLQIEVRLFFSSSVCVQSLVIRNQGKICSFQLEQIFLIIIMLFPHINSCIYGSHTYVITCHIINFGYY